MENTYESGVLPTALRGPAGKKITYKGLKQKDNRYISIFIDSTMLA